MDLETLWYETFPYLCGIGGFVSIVVPGGSKLLEASGVLLIVAAATILRLRWSHRREALARMPTAAEIAAQPFCED